MKQIVETVAERLFEHLEALRTQPSQGERRGKMQTWAEADVLTKNILRDNARTAIKATLKAIEEPTGSMLEAGFMVMGGDDGLDVAIWKAMLSALSKDISDA